MEQSNPPTPGSGPYIQLACFCERVLVEKDNVVSLVRVIDRLMHRRGPLPLEYPAWLVVLLKAGDAKGSHNVNIKGWAPDESEFLNIPPIRVLFEGADRGINIILETRMAFHQEGLYWFDVRLGETLITRLPLRVITQTAALNP